MSAGAIHHIRNAIETADPYSVDAFLESQTADIQKAGKLAIALTLLTYELDQGDKRLNPRRYSAAVHRNMNADELGRADDHCLSTSRTF